MNYKSYFSEIGSGREALPIRRLFEEIGRESSNSEKNLIYLSGGMPNSKTFPAAKASFQLRDGSNLEIGEKEMSKAMQYDTSSGDKELLEWMYELQRRVHNPPTYKNEQHPGKMGCILSCGNQHAMSLVFENLISKGDICLVGTPCYLGFMSSITPLQPQLIGIDTDEHGIIPSKLRQILSRWNPADIQQPGKDGPKMLYCVPTCGNPTGVDLTLGRKKEIYQIAREYNFLIIEDDPYYFLKPKPYVPSFLSMDVDGRVLRLDSMSKVVSAGIRIGMVSGALPFIELIKMHADASTLGPSGLSQHFLLSLLKKWGYEGFFENAEHAYELYQARRRECILAANKHLKDVAEWNEPTGGMFMWIKLKVKDSLVIFRKLIREKGIFIIPGCYFTLDPEQPSSYIRVSFSIATTEELNQCLHLKEKGDKMECSKIYDSCYSFARQIV